MILSSSEFTKWVKSRNPKNNNKFEWGTQEKREKYILVFCFEIPAFLLSLFKIAFVFKV